MTRGVPVLITMWLATAVGCKYSFCRPLPQPLDDMNRADAPASRGPKASSKSTITQGWSSLSNHEEASTRRSRWYRQK